MIDKLELGIVYNEKGKIINHRSLVKVILNPFLRLIGVNIATKYNSRKSELGTPVLSKCSRIKIITFLYDNDKYRIVRRRMFI